MAYRIERVNEIIRECLANQINNSLKDPRLKDAVVGLTSVKTTKDLKYCKIAVSIFSPSLTDKGEIISVLEKSKGFLRKQIAKELTTRTVPELTFELDESVDYAMHIEEVLKGLNISHDDEL